MRILLILVASLLLLGCASEAPQETNQSTVEENATGVIETEETTTEEDGGTVGVVESEDTTTEEGEEDTTETQEENETPNIFEVPDQEEIKEKKSGTPARSQSDCSALSPNCESCVAQLYCGWCKSRNGCFYGDSTGPAPGIADCPSAEWAYTEAECAGSKGGLTCEENWNCADCLTGSGCMWCIEGSKCASTDVTEECKIGGWLTESFQCNLASR